jgi:hypothetical protein
LSNLTTLLVRLLISGSLLFTSLGPTFSEEMSPERRESAEAGLEWSNLAKGRTEFEVSDPSLLPSRLILAAKQTGCRIEEGIETSPVRFTKIGGKRFAIVFCREIVGSHIVLDFSNLQRPRVVSFPFMNLPEGFGITVRPGWITRETENSTFLAETGSDAKPSWNVRHTYKFDGTLGFVVTRVEVKGMPGHEEWTAVWETPRWSLPETTEYSWRFDAFRFGR